ncbi:GPI transamidase component PIG-S isoform X2 [Contarinia nasturtii]|uniref:GPI transamidase component PIG-S isoform X2 n=1 Tax=Contarinia nasturtii TaxID=265458 RepID=UPI0012D459A0|nr:GPI transamidase component PIG-S isoform X2 [Contarinia nasturtii]
MADDSKENDQQKIDSAINELAERKNDNQRILATLAFAFIIIVIGFPMWFKTTEVYRVPLPYSKINLLGDDVTKISSKVGIFTYSNERTKLLMNELKTFILKEGFIEIEYYAIQIEDTLLAKVNTPASLESTVLKKYPLKSGEFMLLEWTKFTEDILVTSDRSAFISSQTTATQIHRVLMQWIYRLPKLQSVLKTTQKLHDRKYKVQKKLENTTPPSAKYDILVSVFHPRPDQQKVRWNIRAAIDTYIQPFLKEIQPVSNFVLKSQWKYQVPFEFSKKQIPNSENKSDIHYAVTEENLPHIITSIEGKLGISIHESPTIHLIIYIPPCDNSPLYLYNSKGQRATNKTIDSFLSQKWGGIIISNPTAGECSQWMSNQEKVEVNINTHSVMHAALFLLRRIIDIHVDTEIPIANINPWESVTPRSWEIDSHLRISAVHLISSATSTLQSLIQLLDGIRNIVINDDVGLAINEAYDNIIKAKSHLLNNDLSNAVFYARLAFENSERAFFDPSLLALLYFPDDQKYAIYIPLFLPVMLPIVLSFYSIYKHFQKDKTIKVKAE